MAELDCTVHTLTVQCDSRVSSNVAIGRSIDSIQRFRSPLRRRRQQTIRSRPMSATAPTLFVSGVGSLCSCNASAGESRRLASSSDRSLCNHNRSSSASAARDEERALLTQLFMTERPSRERGRARLARPRQWSTAGQVLPCAFDWQCPSIEADTTRARINNLSASEETGAACAAPFTCCRGL